MAEHKVTLQPISLSDSLTRSLCSDVYALDMRLLCTNGDTSTACTVLLIIGYMNGTIGLFQTSVSSHSEHMPIRFCVKARFTAHTRGVTDLHFHRSKLLLVSASDLDVKIWSVTNMTTVRLMKHILHPEDVWCAIYSISGLIATGCSDGVLRIYGTEPLFSLCWSFKSDGEMCSMAWSTSNRLAASFKSDKGFVVHVWDSSFQTLFRGSQKDASFGTNSIVFASNDVVLCAGSHSHAVYWYHISNPNLMEMFTKKNVLPFCHDVLKIIAKYLPVETHVTSEPCPHIVTVTGLSCQVVVTWCLDDTFRVYKLDGNKPRLLATLPHEFIVESVMCVYPGKQNAFIIAYRGPIEMDLNVSLLVTDVKSNGIPFV